MPDFRGSRTHMRRYVRLGLQLTLAPDIRWRFPLSRRIRGASRLGASVAQPADMPTTLWIMTIIPIYEASILADAVLQNIIEFWNGEVIEIGSADERRRSAARLRPEVRQQRAIMTVIRDRALISEQHSVRIRPQGFEMNGGVRLELKPAACGREVGVTIARQDRILSEHRVAMLKADTLEMRDAEERLTATIRRTSDRGLPLTDAAGETIRNWSADDQLDAFRRWSGKHEPSIQSFASYGEGTV